MVNWKKFFIFVGIPIITFYIFLIVILFAFISGLFLWVFFIGICSLYFNKREIWKSLSKLSLVFLLVILLFYPNISVIPGQIANHIDRGRIINPNEPLVQQLNSTTPGYMWDFLNRTKGINQTAFYNMSDDLRLKNMTDYIISEVIRYVEVMEQYFVLDYVPTVKEAIQRGWGDCRARTATMVSFFWYMGYNQTYAVEDAFHTYTCVFLGPNKTDPHYYYTQGRTDFMVMYNHQEIIFTKNIFERLGYIFFSERFSKEIRELFQEPTTFFILPGVFIALGFVLPRVVSSNEEERFKRKYLKNAVFSSLIIIGSFIIALTLGMIIPQIILFTLVVAIILAVHAIHMNLGARIFMRNKE